MQKGVLSITHSDYVQMAIDWECARITKPDKPLNARETLEKIHLLNEIGL